MNGFLKYVECLSPANMYKNRNWIFSGISSCLQGTSSKYIAADWRATPVEVNPQSAKRIGHSGKAKLWKVKQRSNGVSLVVRRVEGGAESQPARTSHRSLMASKRFHFTGHGLLPLDSSEVRYASCNPTLSWMYFQLYRPMSDLSVCLLSYVCWSVLVAPRSEKESAVRGRWPALQEVEPRCPKPLHSTAGGGGGAAGAGRPANGRLLSQARFCVSCECMDRKTKAV